jgi:SecD/SecF fusion protein
LERKSLGIFILIILGISSVIAATTPYLISHTTIGLEFKGGYEILYTAESIHPGKPIDKDTLLKTANILASRAN